MNLKGYMGENPPVRVGNQAYEHIQNDVYGQVLVSLLPVYADKRFILSERTESRKMIFQIWRASILLWMKRMQVFGNSVISASIIATLSVSLGRVPVPH